MKSYDVLGYTADADVYCPTCADRRYGPQPEVLTAEEWQDDEGNEIGVIFADSEWDSPQHCSDCQVFLPVALTQEGYDYVRDAVGRACPGSIALQWADYYLDD